MSRNSLPVTAIRVSNRLRSAAKYAETLAEILDDGKVEGAEIRDLEETMDYLKSISAVWRELFSACMELGILNTKKAVSAGTETVGGKITRHSNFCAPTF